MRPARKRNAGVAPGDFGEATTYIAKSTRSRASFQGRRCVACWCPVAQPWHRYCQSCRAWLRFGQALRVMRATRTRRETAT
jgi:hypothetical protein